MTLSAALKLARSLRSQGTRCACAATWSWPDYASEPLGGRALLHRLFWLTSLAAWTGLVLGTWAWAQPLPYPKLSVGQCAGSPAISRGQALQRFLAGPRRSRAIRAQNYKVEFAGGRRMTPWCPICKTGGESKFAALSAEHFLPRFGFPTHPVEAWRCKDCGYIVTDPPLRRDEETSPEFDAPSPNTL